MGTTQAKARKPPDGITEHVEVLQLHPLNSPSPGTTPATFAWQALSAEAKQNFG